MRTNDLPRIHIQQFLAQQQGERYRVFILHGHPYSGKTAFARKVASAMAGVIYFDVLNYVIEHPHLTLQIDLIDAARLREIVITYAAEARAQVLLVDEIDFLVHTWENDLSTFQQMAKSLSVNQTPTIIGFILQTQPVLEAWHLTNTAKQNRILHIEDIAAL